MLTKTAPLGPGERGGVETSGRGRGGVKLHVDLLHIGSNP